MSRRRAASTGARRRCMTIETLGLVLAGGLARRMGGGDKALIRIGGETILERVLARLTPQSPESCSMPTAIRRVSRRAACRWLPTACRISPGRSPAFSPGLDWAAANRPGIEWMVSVPGDCPFLPRDLVARLHQARVAEGKPLACAQSGDWRHPVVGPVAGRAARGSAPRHHGRGSAQDRSVDRAPRRRARRLAGQAGRSVLQREHAGGCRKGDATRSAGKRLTGQHRIRQEADHLRPARYPSRRPPAPPGRPLRSATRSRLRRPADAWSRRRTPSACRVSETRTYSRRPFFLRYAKPATTGSAISGSGAAPASRSSSGRTTRANVTNTATGLPGNPTKRRAAQHAHRDRPARLDRDAPEHQLADLLDRVAHVIGLAGRDAARGQHQIVAARRLGEPRAQACPDRRAGCRDRSTSAPSRASRPRSSSRLAS